MALELDKKQPVIGVFGSDTKTAAERKAVELLAVEINRARVETNRARAVLLSGAQPRSDEYKQAPEPVKDLAVYSLRHVGAGPSATWLGVARESDVEAPREHPYGGFVVTPGWGHRRNFVEACLCDAAIAFGATSPGTASEALFCLFLGRPLVVVGSQPPGTAITARELKGRIGSRVGPEGRSLAVDIGIAEAFAWAETTPDQVTTRSLPVDATSAADIMVDLLEPSPWRKPRPELDRLADEASWDHYVKKSLKAAHRWPG